MKSPGVSSISSFFSWLPVLEVGWAAGVLDLPAGIPGQSGPVVERISGDNGQASSVNRTGAP